MVLWTEFKNKIKIFFLINYNSFSAKPIAEMVVDHNGPVFANDLDVYFLCNATTDSDVPITNYRSIYFIATLGSVDFNSLC